MTAKTLLLATGAVAALLAALPALSVPAAAAVNLVQNGDFTANGGNGELGFNTSAIGWSAPDYPAGYEFLWNGATADTTGATGVFGNVTLWDSTPAPNGGATVGEVAAFHAGPISQLVGLTPGKPVMVTFSWAGAQQKGFSGADTVGWNVSLGSQTQSTGLVNVPSEGFSGWKTASFTFTPTGSSEPLTFLAAGSGVDRETFSLVSGVTATQAGAIPEASTWAMLGLGFAGLGLLSFGKRRRNSHLAL
jgi:opacity protein-like surface antigen